MDSDDKQSTIGTGEGERESGPIPADPPKSDGGNGTGCPACEEGTCTQHEKPLTRREFDERLDEQERKLRKRVAKTVKRFRKTVGPRQPIVEPPPPEPPPAPARKRGGALGYMGNDFMRMIGKKKT